MATVATRPFWLRALGGFGYFLYCGFALLAGTTVGWIGQSTVLREIFVQSIKHEDPSVVFENSSAINVLLLGCDEDLAKGGKKVLREYARSDMMLVARLDFVSKKITGISIPRDLLVSLPGYRSQKINAYHSIGGKDLARQAAESVLGIKIDRTIVVNYAAFQELVDLVGGVEVFVEKKLRYNDNVGNLHINLKPGRQHLNGYDAMCFVRYRHGDSDFARQARQKEFLLAFKDSVLANASRIPQITNAATSVAGGEFSDREIAALLLYARAVGGDNIKMDMVPVIEASHYDLLPDGAKLRLKLEELNFVPRSEALYGNRS